MLLLEIKKGTKINLSPVEQNRGIGVRLTVLFIYLLCHFISQTLQFEKYFI